jgi:hypothetical protein
MPDFSSDSGSAAELEASLRASIRAVLWTHRESLDTLRDAICAFAVDLQGKGMPTAQIATRLREVVTELRASGEQLPAELDDTARSLDETVRWCLDFGVGAESRAQHGDRGGADWNSSRPDGDGM